MSSPAAPGAGEESALSQEETEPTAPDRDSEQILAVELADEFGRAAKLLGGRLSDRLGGHGMSMPRFQLLAELDRHGPLRLTQLGARVGISQGTASTLTEALVQDGLIGRSADPLDGRATRLVLTAEGRDRAQAWMRDYERAAQELFAALPSEQWSTLAAMLRALSAPGPQHPEPT